MVGDAFSVFFVQRFQFVPSDPVQICGFDPFGDRGGIMGDADGTDVERVTILDNLTLPIALPAALPITVAVGASCRALP
jgi:hypothetical protein